MKSTILTGSLGLLCLAGGLLVTHNANAIPFDLHSSTADIIGGNTTSTFYEVSGAGAESGTAASLYSATLGGDANTGFFVKISFDGNSQPVLTSAFLKASNNYLLWDATDLTAFNSGIFDSITLWNDGAGGIKNQNGKFQDTSHAGLNGTPGTSRVPDGGSTIALAGLVLSGLGLIRRKLS